jgi:hypothetical protein
MNDRREVWRANILAYTEKALNQIARIVDLVEKPVTPEIMEKVDGAAQALTTALDDIEGKAERGPAGDA